MPKKIIVAAPVYGDISNPPKIHVGRSMSNPHADGTDNYKCIIDHNGQPIDVPSHTEGNTTSSNISGIFKMLKRQATATFKSGTFA